MHPFWSELYKENTEAVSNPTTGSDPIGGIDFFKVEKVGVKYGPLGELIPLQDPPGSGYFDCVDNTKRSIT